MHHFGQNFCNFDLKQSYATVFTPGGTAFTYCMFQYTMCMSHVLAPYMVGEFQWCGLMDYGVILLCCRCDTVVT